nr:unnamed protein product [Spirometra erinaceieuropaei]
MQRIFDLFTSGCSNLGQIICTEKTVILREPPPKSEYTEPRTNVCGTHPAALPPKDIEDTVITERAGVRARIDLAGHLRTQCNVNATKLLLIPQHTITSSTNEGTSTHLLSSAAAVPTSNNVDSIST